MSDRNEVLTDAQFWLALEFKLSGWFRTSGDRSFGGFWCDAFLPQFATDTKTGVDVSGCAWIGDGPREQRKYSFVVSIPQRMLSRRRNDIALKGVEVDIEHEQLRFAVEPAAGSE
jgi:hypothetical protein|nr:hypothetical protein [uncultured Steroidobacter sp.]